MDDSSDSKLKITPFGEALSIHQTSIYNMQKAIIPIGLRLLLFFSAMTESIFLSQCSYVLAESRLQISCLVLVDNVSLCQLVQHLLYNRVELNSLFLIRHATQLAYSVTHSLCIISVVQGLNLVLTDSLQ